MHINFLKWDALGNDFILIDQKPMLSADQIKNLCKKKFGIGADGLILVDSTSPENQVFFFNQDGSKASICGNALRTVLFYLYEKKKELFCRFWDKTFQAFFEEDKLYVEMPTPTKIKELKEPYKGVLVNVSVPHFFSYAEDLENLIIDEKIFKDRFHPNFGIEGSNISFFKKEGEKVFLRTCERGVEEETNSCGSAAVAISCLFEENFLEFNYKLGAKAYLKKIGDKYFLSGSARQVFSGSIELF
jgi:diaminopimelate epimerase